MAKKLLALLLAVMLVTSLIAPAYAVETDKAPTAADSKTITVGVINWVINDLGDTGYQVHYWNDSTAGDADLTATGKTEQKDVGYWDSAQTFTMYTAEIPADATGYKVHKGDRWFGDDGAPAKNVAYIFNYDGDKALYETAVEPTEAPATEAPVTEAPATDAPATDAPAEDTITVYFVDKLGWGNINVYYWPNGGDWPGTPAEKLTGEAYETPVDGAYTYTATIPASVDGIIFNGNGSQTVDIKTDIADGAKWSAIDEKDGDKYKVKLVTAEEPTDAPVVETDAPAEADGKIYFAPGEWTADNARFGVWVAGWKYNTTKWFALESIGNGIYAADLTDTSSWVSCKFARFDPATEGFENAWNTSAETGFVNNGLYTITAGEWDNASGTWTNNYDPDATEPVVETDAPIIETDEPATAEPATDEPVPADTLIVAGNATSIFGTSWNANDANNTMTYADGKYTKSYDVTEAMEDVQLKAVKNGTAWYGDATGNNVTFDLTGAGTFTVTYDPETGITSVSGDIVKFKTDFDYTAVYAVGNGASDGDYWMNRVSWNPAAEENKMTETSEGVWEFTTSIGEYDPDEVQFKFAVDGAWTHNFGLSDDGSVENGVETDAIYNGSKNIVLTVKPGTTIKMVLDLSGFDFNTKTGAKMTITYGTDEQPTDEPIIETDEPATAEPATDEPIIETDEPVAEGAYYLVGSMNDWAAADEYKLTKNAEAETEEYTITLDLAQDAAFKVIYTDGKTTTWYPDGMGNDYTVAADGEYTVYFRPNADGGEDWHYGVIYAALTTEPATDEPIIETDEPATAEPETAEPATDEPITEGAYYIVGSMNDWAVADAYKLTKNDAAEADEYTITLELAKDAEFKVVYSDGTAQTWYPDGTDNNYVVSADGTYDIYFRPNGDGGEDWHYGVIYAAAQAEPETAEPETTEPATDEPIIETDEPVVEGAYYLVGSMNDWAAADAYKLTKNAEAETEEYTITLDLAQDAAFKVIYTDGKTTTWYPDGMGNDYTVAADGEYTVYFRPNADGGEDWHYGVIYAALTTEPATDEPIIETDEPATAEPETAEPATDEPITEGAYYLVGTMNDWAVADAYKLTKNDAAEADEYTITLELAKDAEFKVVYSDGKAETWYPDGTDNNYVVSADGTYDVYFRPNGDGGEDWHYGVIYAAAQAEPETAEPETAEPETAEPATDEPVAEGAYYLVGSMNDWAVADAYKLAKNDAAEADEYTITLDLAKDAAFKVIYTDGKTTTWYPDGMGNDYTVAADGEYTVYFRPNADGGEDWHYGVIYAALTTEPATDEPIIETDEPATAEPETAEPATDEPITEGAYYLVGTMNEWAVADAYKLTKNDAAEADEYTITLELAKDAEFKVVYSDGKAETWYPDGTDNNYVVTADGTYDIYFRPNGDGGEDWHYGVIYAAAQAEPETAEPETAEPETAEPATDEPIIETDEPVVEGAYYLVGSMNDWAVADAYKLTKNAEAEGDEYTITLDLAQDAAFKVIYTDGKTTTWYPDGMGNDYTVAADGEYTVYFRPNADGGEDWHYGVIYAALTTEPATDEPIIETDEPATAEPETAEPATDEPITEGAYYLVGSMNDWAVADAYKLTKNDAAEADEYTITLELAKDAEFKVVYSDGKAETWYPDGTDNNYVVSADDTYDVYFRPNGDGGEDWHYGVIYAAAQAEPETAEPATAEPATDEPIIETDEPVVEGAYYLVGSMNDWAAADAYKLAKNAEAETEEYTITLDLAKDAAFKVIYTDGKTTTWYPDGMGNDYTVAADGEYTVYFRPNADGGEDWHYGVIYAALTTEPATDEPATAEPETAEPATDEPVAEGAYYLVGSMNDWAVADAYKLAKNEAAEADEYTITLELAKDAEFKVVYSDDTAQTWYPDGTDNNYVVSADGTYDVYFRPNADGGEDWHYGVIYAALQSEQPTSEPATAEPETAEPATDEPVTGSDFFLVGNMNDWAADDAYMFTKNQAADAEEYSITLDLTTESQFKVIKLDGFDVIWYPGGMGNNYGENGEIKVDGNYTVYFRPNGDGGEDWFNGVIYVALNSEAPTSEPSTEEPTSEPATDEPVIPTDEPITEGGYYLVGSMNDWEAADGYKLSKNEAAETEEYTITLDLAKDAAFKVIYTDGELSTIWYPDGLNNDYTVSVGGTYDIYFRPNGDGGEDWHYGVIYAALKTVEPTDEPEPTTPVEVIYGDADGDGEVTSLDVTMIQRALAHLNPSGYNAAVCDVDGDGEVTSMDVSWIQRALAHMTIPENIHIG